jgi:hypothetical protein
MINAFNVRWLERDETKIKFTDEFENQNWVLKADILKDAISDLTNKYDQILKDAK